MRRLVLEPKSEGFTPGLVRYLKLFGSFHYEEAALKRDLERNTVPPDACPLRVHRLRGNHNGWMCYGRIPHWPFQDGIVPERFSPKHKLTYASNGLEACALNWMTKQASCEEAE